MTRKLSPYEGPDEIFEKDKYVRVKAMVPVLKEDTGFSKCVIEVQSYHDKDNEHDHYLLFACPEGEDGAYSLNAIPMNYDENDIILCESIDEDGEVEGDLIKDLTTIFYSIDSVLDMAGEW